MTRTLKHHSSTRHEEERLQNAVIQWFAIALPDNTLYWHTPNGGKMSPSYGRRMKLMGVKAGIPDLFILHDGKLCAIELKTKGGRLIPSQAAMHGLLGSLGCPAAVCRSIDDVAAFLGPRMPLRLQTLR